MAREDMKPEGHYLVQVTEVEPRVSRFAGQPYWIVRVDQSQGYFPVITLTEKGIYDLDELQGCEDPSLTLLVGKNLLVNLKHVQQPGGSDLLGPYIWYHSIRVLEIL